MLGEKHCHGAQSLANNMLREPHVYGAPCLGRTTFTEHRFQGAPCSGSITPKKCNSVFPIGGYFKPLPGLAWFHVFKPWAQSRPPPPFRVQIRRAAGVASECLYKLHAENKNIIGERALEQAGADPEPGLCGRNLLYCWFRKCIHDCVGFKLFTWSHCNYFKQMIAM